jgi:hypothetical protein
MKLETAVFLEPGEHSLPSRVAIPVPKSNHRPRRAVRLQIRTPADAELLQRRNLPIHVLTEERINDLGYPIRLSPHAVVSTSLLSSLQSDIPTVPFHSETAARKPQDEDAVVALLRLDMIGARAVYDANRERFDPTYLLRRILEERAERRASFVRFSDVLPGIPETVDAIPRNSLEQKLAKHTPNR